MAPSFCFFYLSKFKASTFSRSKTFKNKLKSRGIDSNRIRCGFGEKNLIACGFFTITSGWQTLAPCHCINKPHCRGKERKRPMSAYCFTPCSNGCLLGSLLFPRQDNHVQRWMYLILRGKNTKKNEPSSSVMSDVVLPPGSAGMLVMDSAARSAVTIKPHPIIARPASVFLEKNCFLTCLRTDIHGEAVPLRHGVGVVGRRMAENLLHRRRIGIEQNLQQPISKMIN